MNPRYFILLLLLTTAINTQVMCVVDDDDDNNTAIVEDDDDEFKVRRGDEKVSCTGEHAPVKDWIDEKVKNWDDDN